MTFEHFLKLCMDYGHTQVKLVPRGDEDDETVRFYATGQGGPNSCADFDGAVVGNDIINMEQPEAPAPANTGMKGFFARKD